MIEIWLPVVGFNNWYEVSNYGTIRSKTRYIETKNNVKKLRTGQIIKQRKNNRDYHIVDLYDNGMKYTVLVHRLVANAFIFNFDELADQVNHLDGNKSNNRVDNLEWMNQSENMKHSYDTGLRKPASFKHTADTIHRMKEKRKGRTPSKKGIIACNIETGECIRFESQRLASEFIGCHESTISDAVRMKNGNNITNGYKWFREKTFEGTFNDYPISGEIPHQE